MSTELHKVTDPAILARRKYLAIPGSAENIYKNQAYKFILVDYQHRKIRKPIYYAKYDSLHPIFLSV